MASGLYKRHLIKGLTAWVGKKRSAEQTKWGLFLLVTCRRHDGQHKQNVSLFAHDAVGPERKAADKRRNVPEQQPGRMPI
ncbi:hypothetical protein ACMSEF_27500 [Bacteroides thetaiotaomicron]|uniref:hypothetical protein n=1 Tax=Bacteroides thetaiotaomicron TaxID=818 RepID=UPI0039C21D9A